MKSKPLSRHAVLAKGALLGSVTPKLAADAKLDLDAILTGVNAANWVKRKASIAHAIKPLLAKDADIGDVVQLLDKLNPDGSTADPEADVPDAIDANPVEEVLAMLRGKLTDEDLAAVAAKLQGLAAPPAADTTPAAGTPPPMDPNAPPADPAAKKDESVPGAMDEASVKALVTGAEQRAAERFKATLEAMQFVQPWVGQVVAQDSADAVFGAALKILGVSVENVHPSAYRAVLAAQPKPGERRTVRIAADGASGSAASLAKLVPDLGTVKHV